MTKDLLVAYTVKGSAAQRLFASQPNAAEASGIDDPRGGLAVIISAKLEELQDVRKGLQATLQLIADKDIDEFLIDIEHLEKLKEECMDTAVAAAKLLTYRTEESDDGDA